MSNTKNDLCVWNKYLKANYNNLHLLLIWLQHRHEIYFLRNHLDEFIANIRNTSNMTYQSYRIDKIISVEHKYYSYKEFNTILIITKVYNTVYII